MKIRVKFIQTWVDRKTGNVYAYFRRVGSPRLRLPGVFDSPEFWEGYKAALSGQDPAPAVAKARKISNCIEVAIEEYLEKVLPGRVAKGSTRARQTSTLRKWAGLDGVGATKVGEIDADYINRVILEAPSKGVANTWLITVRPFFQWARAKKYTEIDPTAGIVIKLPKSKGHLTWEEEHIAQFEARWAHGTLERLLFSLLLYTGQRCSDVLKLGPTRIINGAYKVTQIKTGAEVDVRLHPELVTAIEAYKVVGIRAATYLHSPTGKPMVQRDLNKLFRAACTAAGLGDEFVPHGLRKGFCRRLADQGVDPWTIASLSGHLTIKEVERYCKAYNRRKRSSEGMDVLIAAYPAKPKLQEVA